MTFDEWWATQGLLLKLGRDYTVLDLKEIAKRAWDIASQQADSTDQNKLCVCADVDEFNSIKHGCPVHGTDRFGKYTHPECHPQNDDKCPECGRQKAHSVHDALGGYCPKWWAVRDQEAENDCKRMAHNKLQNKAVR